MNGNQRCIALLGGSFDPVHNGHVALGDYFAKLLAPDELRILPAGDPWQKDTPQATPEQRVEMVTRAFTRLSVPVTIDQQEIRRHGATYTVETLRAIRAEVGPDVSLVFLIGADQLLQLHTWKDWQQLFEHAHLCAASRPGFDITHLPAAVNREFTQRAATPEQIRATPAGLTYLASDLAVNISATTIRAALQRGERPDALIPLAVLDYIKQHHLYKT